MKNFRGKLRVRCVSGGKRLQFTEDVERDGNYVSYTDFAKDLLKGKIKEFYADFLVHNGVKRDTRRGRLTIRPVSEGKRLQATEEGETRGNWICYSELLRELIAGPPTREEFYFDFLLHKLDIEL